MLTIRKLTCKEHARLKCEEYGRGSNWRGQYSIRVMSEIMLNQSEAQAGRKDRLLLFLSQRRLVRYCVTLKRGSSVCILLPFFEYVLQVPAYHPHNWTAFPFDLVSLLDDDGIRRDLYDGAVLVLPSHGPVFAGSE